MDYNTRIALEQCSSTYVLLSLPTLSPERSPPDVVQKDGTPSWIDRFSPQLEQYVTLRTTDIHYIHNDDVSQFKTSPTTAQAQCHMS